VLTLAGRHYLGPGVKLGWLTEIASPDLARKPITMLRAPSVKPQALLTMDQGYCRMNLERRIMEVKQLKRIADAIEEILRLVKKDMEPKKK